jgi:cytochrome c556
MVELCYSQSLAPDKAIADRQATMKQMGLAMKQAAGYANGAQPFDAEMTRQIMKIIEVDANELTQLFPAGSDKGSKSFADPKIWQVKDEFVERLQKLSNFASSASSSTSAAALKTALHDVGSTCLSCHAVYRKK